MATPQHWSMQYGDVPSDNKPIHMIGIYHPPPNGEHNTTNGMLTYDITELLVNKLPQYQSSILLGDFNIHTEDLTSAECNHL